MIYPIFVQWPSVQWKMKDNLKSKAPKNECNLKNSNNLKMMMAPKNKDYPKNTLK